MPATFHHLTDPTPDEIAQIRTIYTSNFPPVMQKPFSDIEDGSRDGSVVVLVARDGDQPERITGIATLARLSRTPSLYLGYFATDQRLHNQGLGGALFDYMVAFVTANHPDMNAVVWEVEAPEADPAHIHNRRIRFYERRGARVVRMANTYRMPAGDDTIPLRLMWIPVRGRTHLPGCAEVAAWIDDIYDLVYPGGEALAARLIAELDDSQPE
jgi:GNAT superfamily N-acetyltransferase